MTKLAFFGAAAALWSIACGGAARATDPSAGGASSGGRTAAGGGKESTAGGASSAGGASQGGAHAGANGGAAMGGSGNGSGGHASGTGGALHTGGAPGAATGGAPAILDAGAGGAAHPATDVARIVAEYRTWHPQTDTPVDVSSYIFALCRLPTLKEQAFAESEHGKYRRLQDWANDAAVAGIAGDAGSHVFPEGAAIVKEKYILNTKGALELVARGFMIKREAGFDPARGDWDYAYWEPALGILHTEEQSQYCGGCHIGAGSTDSVFIDGLRP